MLDKLRESTKWTLGHEQIENINKADKRLLKEAVTVTKKQALEMGRQVGIKIGKYKGIEKGKEIGFGEGKVEWKKIGKYEEKIEIAKESIKKGLSCKLISELTGLSKAEISKLAEENK